MDSSGKRTIGLLSVVAITVALAAYYYARSQALPPKQEVPALADARERVIAASSHNSIASLTVKRDSSPRPVPSYAAAQVQLLKERAEKLRRKYQPYGFSVVIEPPFVVLGDEEKDIVKEHVTNTVAWAVRKLRQDFFTRDPEKIIDIWLFKDDASYRKSLKEFFNTEPTTPFGFYSFVHGSLFMNIDTGGGTLVHEIVHAR
jgi:hypothetical protein